MDITKLSDFMNITKLSDLELAKFSTQAYKQLMVAQQNVLVIDKEIQKREGLQEKKDNKG